MSDGGDLVKRYAVYCKDLAAWAAQKAAEADVRVDRGAAAASVTRDPEEDVEQTLDTRRFKDVLQTKAIRINDRLAEVIGATDRMAEMNNAPEQGSRAPGARKVDHGETQLPASKKRGPYKKPAPKLEEVHAAFRLDPDVKRSVTVHNALEYATIVEAIKTRHQITWDRSHRLTRAIRFYSEVEAAVEFLGNCSTVHHELVNLGEALLGMLGESVSLLEALDLARVQIHQR